MGFHRSGYIALDLEAFQLHHTGAAAYKSSLCGRLVWHRCVKRAVDFRNIRSLEYVKSADLIMDTGPRQMKLALVNARSISNKSLILNDFFTSQDLDFLFVMETWLKTGELDSLSDITPVDCDYLNSPRVSGCGGGLLSVFNKRFKCGLISGIHQYSTFEIQLFSI